VSKRFKDGRDGGYEGNLHPPAEKSDTLTGEKQKEGQGPTKKVGE